MTESTPSQPQLVRDLMTVGVQTCPPDTALKNLAEAFCDHGWEDVVVLEDGNAVGVVGQVELVRAYTRADRESLTAADIMREDLPVVPPDIPLLAAAQLMLDMGVRSLFLTHRAGGVEYPAAVISFWHILRYLGAGTDDDLQDLGIYAARKSPVEVFTQKRDAARRNNITGG